MSEHNPAPTLDADAFRPFDSVEHFILGCTDQIWRDRGVGLISSMYYDPNVVVHSALGTSRGHEPVVEGTLQSMSSYPDEVGFGEDVVWEPRGPASFISSHRVYSTGTNTGRTGYGPATGRHFEKRALAHCLVENGRIIEEWVVRDEYRLVTDLGYDPPETARRLAHQMAWQPLELGELPNDPCREGVSGPRGSGPADDDCDRIVDMVERTWNERRLDQLPQYVDPNIVLHTSRGRTLQGHAQLSTETIDVLAPLPDARMRIIDICAHDHPRRGRRITTLWVLGGTYIGHARYGPTTGQQVEVLGSSQFMMQDGWVTDEFRVYDELAILIQIEQARRDRPAGST